jgi:hypothetical protein
MTDIARHMIAPGRTVAEMEMYYKELDFVLNMLEVAAFTDFLIRWRIKLPDPTVIMTDPAMIKQWTQRQLEMQMRLLILNRPTFTRDQKDAALIWLTEHKYSPVPDASAEGHVVTFLGENRQATVPSNPAFPNGRDVRAFKDLEGVEKICTIPLQYPAPECGRHRVICRRCGLVGMVTAAGRPDDPRSLTIECRKV